jgi:predicted nucleic acid-binding protein
MQTAVRDLESDLRAGIVIVKPVPDAAYARAKSLAQALTPSIGLRAADVLHVAAAIELGAGALFTFDQRQHKAATAAGLAVNPLSWPH